jgi:outer membrane protein assembly factor BamB
VWTNRLLGTFTSTAIEKDGFVYGINLCDTKQSGAELKCVEWETGKVRWAEKGFGQGTFLNAGDKLLLLSDKGELTAARFSPEKFELLRRDQVIGGTCWTPPILANGRLYVRNSAGELVCLEVGPNRAI